MHVTWLVSDVEAFFESPGPTSSLDQILPDSLSWREWVELFFVALGVEPEQLKVSNETGKRIVQFSTVIEDYPMLSRIRGVYYDAVFRADEVHLLEEECKRLLPKISSPLARTGLQKLLKISDEAMRLNLSIFLMCD